MKDITVFIPVYNAKSTINKTLKSLENQNTNNIDRIIIMDDGSTDGSKELIHDFSKKSRFFIEIRENKKPSGLAHKYNQIINEIGTKYLILMHADIVIEDKNSIETYRNEIVKNENTYIVYGFEKIPLESRIKYNFRLKLERAPFVYDTIKNGGYFCCAGKFDMLNVGNIKKIGGYDEKKYFMAGEDTDLYLSIKENGGEILNMYVNYQHLHSFDNTYSIKKFFKRKFRYRQATGVIFRNHLRLYWRTPSLYVRLFISIMITRGIVEIIFSGNYFLLAFSMLLVLLYTYHYCRLFLNKKYRDYRVLLMPILFIYLILGGTYYFFQGLIRNKQTI